MSELAELAEHGEPNECTDATDFRSIKGGGLFDLLDFRLEAVLGSSSLILADDLICCLNFRTSLGRGGSTLFLAASFMLTCFTRSCNQMLYPFFLLVFGYDAILDPGV